MINVDVLFWVLEKYFFIDSDCCQLLNLDLFPVKLVIQKYVMVFISKWLIVETQSGQII